MTTSLIINPGRRRRSSRPRRSNGQFVSSKRKRKVTRKKATRRNPIVAKRRRRRSSSRRRTSRRRRTFRNPGFPKIAKGLDLQGAMLAVAGAAAAKFIVNKLPIADTKMKAAATVGIGVALGMLPLGPMRSKLALGGQIAGISMLLAEFAPNLFADDGGSIVSVPPGMEQLNDGYNLGYSPDEGSTW